MLDATAAKNRLHASLGLLVASTLHLAACDGQDDESSEGDPSSSSSTTTDASGSTSSAAASDTESETNAASQSGAATTEAGVDTGEGGEAETAGETASDSGSETGSDSGSETEAETESDDSGASTSNATDDDETESSSEAESSTDTDDPTATDTGEDTTEETGEDTTEESTDTDDSEDEGETTDESGDSADTSDMDCPDDDGLTGEQLLAWLEGSGYTTWEAESEVHPSTGPHFGGVRTFVGPCLAQSLDDANEQHPVGAVSVKELYGSGDNVLGWAVMRKVADQSGGDSWYWYEVYNGRVYADDVGSGLCTGCHSGGKDYFLSPWPLN